MKYQSAIFNVSKERREIRFNPEQNNVQVIGGKMLYESSDKTEFDTGKFVYSIMNFVFNSNLGARVKYTDTSSDMSVSGKLLHSRIQYYDNRKPDIFITLDIDVPSIQKKLNIDPHEFMEWKKILKVIQFMSNEQKINLRKELNKSPLTREPKFVALMEEVLKPKE